MRVLSSLLSFVVSTVVANTPDSWSSTDEAGQKYLAEKQQDDGVITLPSGLMYKVLKAGEGKKHPLAGTPCDCHYKGADINGKEFDSSYSRGSPTTFAPNQVIKGWTEAMQLMVVGDKWEMYIPAALAYGDSGAGGAIKPKAALVFTMEIMKIKEGAPTKDKVEL